MVPQEEACVEVPPKAAAPHKRLNWGSLLLPVVAIAAGTFVASWPKARPPSIPDGSSLQDLPSWPLFWASTTLLDIYSSVSKLVTPPHIQVQDLSSSYWRSELTYALTKHGVFDAVSEHGGEVACSDLGGSLALSENFVCRLMDAGTSLYLLRKHKGKFQLTATGELLRTAHPSTLAPLVLMFNEELRDSWRNTATHGDHGADFVSLHQSDSDNHQMAQYDMAMKGMSVGMSAALVGDWAPPANNSTICDIGGGLGHVLVEILMHYPGAKGLLLEKPAVAARAEMNIAQAGHGLNSRLQVVSGDIHAPLSPAFAKCDVFYLKFIMHSFDENKAVELLSNIRTRAKPGARLVITEFVKGASGPTTETFKAFMDLSMLAATAGGRERTFTQYKQLFRAAGLTRKPRLVRMRAPVSSIEVDLAPAL